MLRRRAGRWSRGDSLNDEAPLQGQEDTRYDARDWEGEEPSAASYYTGEQEEIENGPAEGENDAAYYAEGASGDALDASAACDTGKPGASYGDEQQYAYDAYDAEGEFGPEGEQDWDEAPQDEEDTGERALALHDAPQLPMRRSIAGGMLLRLAGERRELAAPLEPRATGPLFIPGRHSLARPGALGHAPVSLRARRPRPFFMYVAIAALIALTAMTTAFAIAPVSTENHILNSFTGLAGFAAPGATKQASYHWYTVLYGDSLTSIANRFGVQASGILVMNGLQDADQLYVGMRLKIPTDPNYGKGAQVGVVDIPPLPPDISGNIFGTNPWNSISGLTDPNNICAPQGNSDTQADRQAFQLGNPNPGSSFARGYTWYHNGVDLDNPNGSPIRAAQAGLVVFAGWDTLGLGWSVKINHCWGLSTMYGHMLHPPLVHAGDYVTAGQQIGQEGATGNATGPHLHFMTEWGNKPANPYCFDFVLPAGNTPCTA
jgi:murein DD-endopeptidase MepM/ murein hydrolase activator NlpD